MRHGHELYDLRMANRHMQARRRRLARKAEYRTWRQLIAALMPRMNGGRCPLRRRLEGWALEGR